MKHIADNEKAFFLRNSPVPYIMQESFPVVQTTPSRHLLVQRKHGNTRTMCEISSKLTIKIRERRQ